MPETVTRFRCVLASDFNQPLNWSYTFVYARGYSYMTDNAEACMNCHVMQAPTPTAMPMAMPKITPSASLSLILYCFGWHSTHWNIEMSPKFIGCLNGSFAL